jgi:protocatechuate 3,4-dioxygenase beta subunit
MAMPNRTELERRSFLVGAGALILAGCSDDSGGDDGAASTSTTEASSTTRPAPAEPIPAGSLTVAQFAGLPVCVALPSAAAGPFPTIRQLDRRDVTEGYPGHPLRLGVRVIDEACEPVPGAEVEIWHADASGDYSSFEDGGSGKDEGEGTTFLRGFQTADADGILEFLTIYPGRYGGRAVHIHLRARIEGDTVLTTQLYFDEVYTEAVMATGEYAQFGPPDTTWATDGLAGDPAADGTAITLSPAATALGEGTLGLVNVGLRR